MIKDLLKEELSLSSESKALSFYGGLFLVCTGLFSIIWLFILTRDMTVVSKDIFGNSEKKVVGVTEIVLQESKGE